MQDHLVLGGIYIVLVCFIQGQTSASKQCEFKELDTFSLEECGDYGIALQCDNKNLNEIPRTFPAHQSETNISRICLLDLSHNQLGDLEDYTFTNVTNLNPFNILWLFLQNSCITNIPSKTFSELSNLMYLNLSENALIWPDSFGFGVFRPLVNLKDLNLKGNPINSFRGMGEELSNANNLDFLRVELCAGCTFDTDFINLFRLTKLSLSGWSKQSCNASILTKDIFVGVPRLKHLWLSNCNIEVIEADTFTRLNSSLMLLDISKNENLHFKGMNKALHGLRNSETLLELNVNQIHSPYDYGIRVKKSDIVNLKTLKVLERLYLDLNKIEVFDERIFHPVFQLPGTLSQISLAGNRLSFGKYVNVWHSANNITFLDISKQHFTHGPFFDNHNEPDITAEPRTARKKRFSNSKCACQEPHVVCIPQKLHTVIWRSSFIYAPLKYNLNVCGAESLKHLDLSLNFFTKWTTPVKGLKYLKHLDISENFCDEVSPSFFKSFKTLEHLNVSSNILGESLDPAKCNYSNKIFSELTRLTKLDLSNNKIERLPRDVFENLNNLKYLNLSSNMLVEWNVTFSSNTSLKRLDLSGNKLTTLPIELTNYLDRLCRNKCELSLILSSNPFQCKCDSLPFYKWMLSTKVEITFSDTDECLLKSGRFSLKKSLQAIADYLENEACTDRSWIAWAVGSAVSGILACIISVVICRIVYKNRWKLRYLYYSRNRRYRHEGFGRLFENDAFISYAKSKASFIKSSMVPSLEKQRGLRLWVADRNSIPGTSVAENIIHGIYNSRKSVLLIDKDYLKDNWCDYEMNMAHLEAIEAKRKLIILVLMEHILPENLPISIMNFLRNERSLEYPEDHQDLDLFWTNLADEIMQTLDMRNIAYLIGSILVTAILFVAAAVNKCTIDDLTNNGYTINCRNLSFTKVPKYYPKFEVNGTVYSLDLSMNSFVHLDNGTFLNVMNLNISRIGNLNLGFSNISYISPEAFYGLTYLRYLNLSGNYLSCPDRFKKGVFKPLISLKYLNIKENKLNTFAGLGTELGYLRNLEALSAELCDNCSFGKDFEKLQNLKNVSLSGRSPDTCNATVLRNNTFEGLTMVKCLWLSSCNIEKIEADAFRPMNRSLTHLDISYNEKLQFDGMNKALYGLRFSATLSVLNVNRIHNVHGLGVELKASDLENLSTLRNLSKLFMDLNKIEIFDEKVFNPTTKFPTSLRVLTIAENRISYGEYFIYFHTARSITCLDISRQHLYNDPFIAEHYEQVTIGEESISIDDVCFGKIDILPEQTCTCLLNFPPNLRRLKWRKSFLNFDLDADACVCGAKNLLFLDLSFNLFTKWKSSTKGLENLKHLDLSENYCSDIAPDFFDHFTELQYLNVSGNFLGPTLEKTLTDKPNGIFRNLNKLTDLDLSRNEIVRFSDRGFFMGIKNIHHLYLHSNRLIDWDYDMPESLKLINLSQNKLSSLSPKVRDHFDKVCISNICNITVILLNNFFKCDCDNLPFLNWMLSTNVNIKIDTCILNSEEKRISKKSDLDTIVNDLKMDVCNDKTWITWTVGTVCVVLGGLSSIITALGVYRYRWKLRYLYYRRNRRFNHEGFERLFENDAFVSYAKSNASFIKRYMVPSLEKERGLRLWVADRNSMPGTSIAENITHGINISRKAVLLMDKAYLNDNWCNYEMNMAHVESTETKRKMIIIVLMEDIPFKTLPICTMRFLRSERSLEYPAHGQDLETFWTDLADQIMS
ncbi:uncharacterized protein LOC132746478 [Ruditapes philippinarum]|uniref:uncharacterized protein LOC132746478 n=1 Tax=Ruditapes philippinarum TaxID=129788 RepID=UPI00295BF2D8|nr:uncharacterized protein LOC132746478 [Ruditapes philippinarum]